MNTELDKEQLFPSTPYIYILTGLNNIGKTHIIREHIYDLTINNPSLVIEEPLSLKPYLVRNLLKENQNKPYIDTESVFDITLLRDIPYLKEQINLIKTFDNYIDFFIKQLFPMTESWVYPYENVHLSKGMITFLSILINLNSNKDYLYLEYPENNLHPKYISLIGQLIGIYSNPNRKCIVETNSTDLIDPLRILVKEEKVNHSSIHINFLYQDTSLNPAIKNPKIDKDGGIDIWPSNFFDQTEKNLLSLI
jgi:hypothetical protein